MMICFPLRGPPCRLGSPYDLQQKISLCVTCKGCYNRSGGSQHQGWQRGIQESNNRNEIKGLRRLLNAWRNSFKWFWASALHQWPWRRFLFRFRSSNSIFVGPIMQCIASKVYRALPSYLFSIWINMRNTQNEYKIKYMLNCTNLEAWCPNFRISC